MDYPGAMKAPSLPLLGFVSCGMIWGSTFLVIRVGNDSLPAVWACALRLILACVVLHSILLLTRTPWPKGAALKAAAHFGLWEFGISLPLLYWGERVVTSGLAAVIYALCPVAAMFAGAALGLDRITFRRLGAALLALAGVAVIFWRELTQGGSTLGLASVLVAAIAAPMAGLMLQRAPAQNPFAANAVGSLVGIPFCLAASFVLRERQVWPTTGREAFPVIYLALAGSVVAFVIFAWLLTRWKTSTVAFLGVIVPVIAVILGTLDRHEAFSTGNLAGAVIVVVGVTIALSSEGEAKLENAAQSQT